MNEIIHITIFTVVLCLSSTILSMLISTPLSIILELSENHIAYYLKFIISSLNSTPPVLCGVLVYLLFSYNGLFGRLNWLYSYKVMLIAQMMLIVPITSSQIMPAIATIKNDYLLTSRGLNLSNFQILIQLIKEIPTNIMAASLLGFGRAISEVGSAMIVGGNIRFKTRVLTTSIVLETSKGNYEASIKLGIILLIISIFINHLFRLLGSKYDMF